MAAGRNREGQCDVGQWRGVVAVSCGDWRSIGPTSNGHALGGAGMARSGQLSISIWSDLVGVSAGYLHTTGLTAQGKVLATGDNKSGACGVTVDLG